MKKALHLIDVFSISTGAMISSGLFVLPGLAFAKAGPAMILSYLLAALLIVPSMLAKAELSTAMPKSGGTYFFIDRSLGPVLGTFGGLANWFSLSLKSAFALIGIGAFAVLIFPHITVMQIKIIAAGACILFTLFNILSVKIAGRIQVVLVFIMIVILTGYIGRGFIATHPDQYVPFMPNGIWSVISTAGLVFVSFGGLTKIASVAEEIHNPSRNIPLGMGLSFLVVTFLYILAVAVTVGVIPGSELASTLIPLSRGAFSFMGSIGAIILALTAIAAFITTANAGILAASRSPLAMSRDRLLPLFFSKIHPRFSTPHISIFFTSIFMVAMILFLNIEHLVKTASTLMIILFMLDNISVIVMRESRIQNYQPKYKMIFYPWLPAAAVIAYSFLLIEMGRIPIIISSAFFLIGCIGYITYSRMRINRTSAITHIVKRIMDKELKTETLDKELKEIVIERDEIIEDRFDKLIKKSEILDIEKTVPVKEVFQKIAEIFSRRYNIEKELMVSRFLERECQSGTVIRPGLAIPHIIVPGSKCFDVLPVRCRDGLQFSGSPDPVHTMFVLVGSIDERNYHLRALMAIAYIVQDKDFEKKWLRAKNNSELRDIILLSNRLRDQQSKYDNY